MIFLYLNFLLYDMKSEAPNNTLQSYRVTVVGNLTAGWKPATIKERLPSV